MWTSSVQKEMPQLTHNLQKPRAAVSRHYERTWFLLPMVPTCVSKVSLLLLKLLELYTQTLPIMHQNHCVSGCMYVCVTQVPPSQSSQNILQLLLNSEIYF